MPLSKIQSEVLKRIAVNRSPESYLAGATLIHRQERTPRFSQDLDFFHDLAESVAQSAETDARTLLQAGYGFEWLLRTPTFSRAVVTAGKEQLRLEWAQDSAFRFFPVVPDERFGYCLHAADAAINKMLALAGRSEVRDFVDVLYLHENYLSVGALVWAGCGKDPGFSPEFLLDQAGRHSAYTQSDLDRLRLRAPLDVRQLKVKWLAALDDARKLLATLPPAELGCLYLNADLTPRTPDPASETVRTLTRHYGCIRGAWPTFASEG